MMFSMSNIQIYHIDVYKINFHEESEIPWFSEHGNGISDDFPYLRQPCDPIRIEGGLCHDGKVETMSLQRVFCLKMYAHPVETYIIYIIFIIHNEMLTA